MYLFYVKFVDLNIYEFIHMSFSIDTPFSFTQQNQFYYLIEKSYLAKSFTSLVAHEAGAYLRFL